MKILAIPDPYALGTDEAESLPSLIGRTAHSYRVKTSHVVRLALMTEGMSGDIATYNRIDCWLGHTKTARRLIDGLELLSGRRDVALTSLCNLGPLVGHGRSLVSDSVRVCPACVHPETGIGYGMLSHQMHSVSVCHVHDVTLREACEACGRRFPTHQDLLPGANCGFCNSPLWLQTCEPRTLSNYQKWSVRQCCHLIAHASGPEATQATDSWRTDYRVSLARMYSARADTYTAEDRQFLRDRMRAASRHHSLLPSFSTLLRMAAMQSVDIVEFIKSPRESSSPRLCKLDNPEDPTTPRDMIDSAIWSEARRRLEILLETGCHLPLPSKRSAIGDLGVTVSGFWQHFPDLAVRYENERARRAADIRSQQFRVACAEANRIFEDGLNSLTDIKIKEASAAITQQHNVPKRIAECAVAVFLATTASNRYVLPEGFRGLSRTLGANGPEIPGL